MTEKADKKDECCCIRKNCIRHGKCEECIEYHRTSKKYPEPYCERKRKKGMSK